MKNLRDSNTAVMVIDMIEAEKTGVPAKEWSEISNAVTRLLEVARNARMSVIHIFSLLDIKEDFGPFQYEADSDPFLYPSPIGPCEPLAKMYHIVQPCYPRSGEWMFAKKQSDALAQRNWLKKTPQFHHVRNVILTGVFACDCVGKTAMHARKSYNVFVPPETTDAEYDWGMPLDELREHRIKTLKLPTMIKKLQREGSASGLYSFGE